MSIVTESILVESKSARDRELGNLSPQGASEILNKVKALYFALWQQTITAVTEQVADFYEVNEANLRKLLKNHREEFDSDGLKAIRGNALKDARNLWSLPSKTSQVTIWTPRAVLRAGMLMRDSEVAKAVRTSLLNAVEKVIPAQEREIERLKLELELIRAKQRYQDTAQAILASTSPAMLAYLRGDAFPPVSIQYRDRFIDATTGQAIDSQDGRSLTQLIADAGLNPKSTSARNRVKKILRVHGWDYDTGSGWSTTSYLREYKVLSDEIYDCALKTVLAELTTASEQQNLFVYQFKQGAIMPHSTHDS
jgi:hypothetical protein